jgi:hypothetical protein
VKRWETPHQTRSAATLVDAVVRREAFQEVEGPPAPLTPQAHGQGSVKSFVVVIARIASTTPSLTPRPESLTPPKGVSSVR